MNNNNSFFIKNPVWDEFKMSYPVSIRTFPHYVSPIEKRTSTNCKTVAGRKYRWSGGSSIKWCVLYHLLLLLIYSSSITRLHNLGQYRVNEEEGVKLTEESGMYTSMILNCECFDIFFIRILRVNEYYDVIAPKKHPGIAHGL